MTETIGRVQRAAAAPGEEEASVLAADLVANLGRVLLGSPEAVATAAVAVLAGGHLLIEDVPGVGKTVLAHAVASSLGAGLARVQGHADLLPSDVTGVSVYSPEDHSWSFRPGPIFAHVVLADELNRTPPRTQSALLEAMEEGQVTVDGRSWPLPDPHMVIATQNPVSQRGTYPLVESQLDRFAVSTTIGYPDAARELEMILGAGGRPELDLVTPVCDPSGWAAARQLVARTRVDATVGAYAVALCRATRGEPGVELGASPRASIWMIRAAQARAVLAGRGFVTPDDVKASAEAVLAHRLVLGDGPAGLGRLDGPGQLDGSGSPGSPVGLSRPGGLGAARAVVASVVERTPVPRP